MLILKKQMISLYLYLTIYEDYGKHITFLVWFVNRAASCGIGLSGYAAYRIVLQERKKMLREKRK
jgi:hypothetical protein